MALMASASPGVMMVTSRARRSLIGRNRTVLVKSRHSRPALSRNASG
jgi:hypothetical protein